MSTLVNPFENIPKIHSTLGDYSFRLSRQDHINADPALDGIEHYNTHYDEARTQLGKRMSFRQRATFIHPALGEFYSVEAFWHFITAGQRHDALRFISADRFPTQEELDFYGKRKVDNFYRHMADAVYHRVDQDPALKETLINSDKPFALYYMFEGSVKPVAIKSTTKGFHLSSIHYIRDVFRGLIDYVPPPYEDLL